MIKNYIFDFGNVITEFIPEKLAEPYIEDKSTLKTVCDVVFDRLYWDKLDVGTITESEVKNAFSDRLPNELYDTACSVFDNWINHLTPIKGICDLIAELKNKNSKLYLLSNISVRFSNEYKNVSWIKDLFELFDGMVFSGTIGLVKPGKDIFEYVLNEFNLKADECLFIDDSLKNIHGAEQMGINGYLFDGDTEKLHNFIFNN